MHPNLRRSWTVLALLCIPVFVGSLDLTVVSAILPEVVVSLGLPPESRLDDAAWMVTGYLLAYTISMTFTGRLSDLLGRRRVFVAFLLLFMFGSYFVAVAHTWPAETYLRIYREFFPDDRPPAPEIRTLHMIILGRVLQALGAGAMAPVTMALVADLFPKHKRARPIGLVGAVDTVGWVLGHLYGGIMVRFFGANGAAIRDAMARVGLDLGVPDWRTLFVLNLGFGLITLAAVFIGLRGVPQQRHQQRFDLLGASLLTAALITLTFGLGGTPLEGPSNAADLASAAATSHLSWPLLGSASVIFLLFLLVEGRTRHPLTNLQLFRQVNVSAAAFINICVGFSLAIGLAALPIMVNFRAGETNAEVIQQAALVAGVLLSGLTVPMALAAFPGGWLTDRRGYRLPTATGLALSGVGFVFCSLTWDVDTPYWVMGLQMAVIGVGLGMTIAPLASAVINAAGETERGSASALVLALRLVGMTLALSSLTTYIISEVNRRFANSSAGVQDTSALYLEKIVEVVNEAFLIGAAVCLAGLLAALLMRGGSAGQLAQETAADEGATPLGRARRAAFTLASNKS
ncbi:MAG: MFS transporter [Anaerolineae bacterium]|nr:MFS transporter [Anaerolineae bacterium]